MGSEDHPSSLLVEMGRKREAGRLQRVQKARIIQLLLGLVYFAT